MKVTQKPIAITITLDGVAQVQMAQDAVDTFLGQYGHVTCTPANIEGEELLHRLADELGYRLEKL